MARLSRKQIAWRVAQDIQDGTYVNLGIGAPELVANYLPDDREVIIHCENGLLGMGPTPPEGEENPDLINAGKKPVTLVNGASIFHHTDSFAMIRGGHLDICVLGAFQVSERGDLANWATLDNSRPPGVGGAMDLALGAKDVFIITDQCTRDDQPKLLESCTYPLTGKGVVSRVYTDHALIDLENNTFVVREIVEGISQEELQNMTGANLVIADNCTTLRTPEL
ncbi:MAG: 3-oxoadipate CoA-transferase [Rhodospirillaceae bacterium]|nr:3-oxoadipate CoA-transferase [Rhodospirillaceae bacterium]|tara:strand:+ start:1960 stop:2631 length:672 start_codon:yes stop_codon:yes gene_type:complete